MINNDEKRKESRQIIQYITLLLLVSFFSLSVTLRKFLLTLVAFQLNGMGVRIKQLGIHYIISQLESNEMRTLVVELLY